MLIDRQDVIRRLTDFNIAAEPSALLDHCIARTTERICNETNLNEIPDGLSRAAIDMAAGCWIQTMMLVPGGVPGYDLGPALKSEKMGDTTYDYRDDSSSDETRLNSLVSELMDIPGCEYSRYRVMQWIV